MVISSSFSGHDMLQNLLGSIGHATWFATPENEWNRLFMDHLPGWLFVKDRSILQGFYEGESSFYNRQVIKAWIIPVVSWTIFVLALNFMMLCINVLVRRQWTENEKLAYPIIQLPVAMIQQNSVSDFFRNKIMWAGFSIAFGLSILNGLHFLFPSVPELNVSMRDVGHYLTGKPWNAVGWVPISLFPFAIGIAFFLPLDLSFSCWFFYVFRKLIRVVGVAAGIQSLPGFPYFNEQATGAWIMLALLALWASRRHFREIAKRIFYNKDTEAHEDEPMSYRAAIAGFFLGSIFLIAFSGYAGMSIWVSVLLFGIYFLLSIAMTRVRAELGAPHEIYFVNPQEAINATIGTKRLGTVNMTIVCGYYWWNRCYRSHQMPCQLEAFKMSQVMNIRNLKRFPIIIILGSLVSILSGFWIGLDLYYREGASSGLQGNHIWVGSETFNRLQRWMNMPSGGGDGIRISFMIVGSFVVILMMFLRMRFLWWPFHPAGYALAISYAMEYYWFAFFISWLIKLVIMKYGGISGHRKAVPFFLGIILGDYAMGSIWSIIGASILHAPVYRMFY
ncbi:hypothetical protein GF312_12325 [Candidatus Poribacteria bacterium]|nr:hypothetical protein [Candidatus Poribacteria bacterium]